jgi:polyphosphate kinase
MDHKSYARWYDYSRARDEMMDKTDTSWAPWHMVKSDDKRRARLSVIHHLLSRIPYEEIPRAKVELPKRKKDEDYVEPDYQFKFIPEVA